jgi:hypothetical protein
VHDGMILQHRDHGNGRLTTLITSTEGGGARATRQYFARSPHGGHCMLPANGSGQSHQFSCSRPCLKWREGSQCGKQ